MQPVLKPQPPLDLKQIVKLTDDQIVNVLNQRPTRGQNKPKYFYMLVVALQCSLKEAVEARMFELASAAEKAAELEGVSVAPFVLDDSEADNFRGAASIDLRARFDAHLETIYGPRTAAIQAKLGGTTATVQKVAPAVPVDPAIYEERRPSVSIPLDFPFTVDERLYASIDLLPPTFEDVEAVLQRTINPLQLYARMAGVDERVLRALRWPDSERVHINARLIAPELGRV